MKNHQGLTCSILQIVLMLFLFTPLSYASDQTGTNQSAENTDQSGIEEGWVEKKIAPPTQWVESIFAPFTQWMESEIQRTPEADSLPNSQTSNSKTPYNNTDTQNINGNLISNKQAINTVLKHHPGKILRSQFQTGPPPHYQIKVLSKQGNVAIFYIHAFNGKPFIPDSLDSDIQEDNS